jgi:uncharacterized membrane protein YeiB
MFDMIYEIIKWTTIIVCEILTIVGSSLIERKQVTSTASLGIVTAMTAIFVGIMMLSAFLQFESKEYLGTCISAVIALGAMSFPYWLPQTLEGKEKTKKEIE